MKKLNFLFNHKRALIKDKEKLIQTLKAKTPLKSEKYHQ